MDTLDAKDKRIAELEALLLAANSRIAVLVLQVADLEARLAKDSSNSSKPPSSDGPGKRKVVKPPTGRRRGGQPGHKGHRRQRVVPDRVHELKPAQCGKCAAALTGEDRFPTVHQVIELPDMKPQVDEYRRHALTCPACRHVTRASLPAGVPQDTMGPRLKALAAALTASFKASKRGAAAFLQDVLNVPICAASICRAEREVAAALAKPVAEGQAMLEASTAANADETGWILQRARAWLWVMAGSSVVMFRVLASRSSEDARKLLGTFDGVLSTDRHGAYTWVRLRQVCWAHLKRDFKALSERPGDAHDWGLAFLAVLPPVFELWHRFKDGALSRTALGVDMKPHMEEMRRLLAEGVLSEDDHLARFCAGLERVQDALWTFGAIDNVEPTNNHAERVLRHAVILRKIIFGTDSPDGAVRLERMLSAVMSLRLQKRNVFQFLEQACRAHLNGTQPPSLLPVAVITGQASG